MARLQALAGFGALSVDVCSVWRPVESHSIDPIRMVEIFGRGGGMGQRSREPVRSPSASRLDSMQDAQTDFTSQSFGSPSTRQPLMQDDEKGKARFLPPPRLHGLKVASGGAKRASDPVFTCQGETSDLLKRRPMQAGQIPGQLDHGRNLSRPCKSVFLESPAIGGICQLHTTEHDSRTA
jgi:hypothetical protein